MTHTSTIRVRYAECDPMGVAHHTAYPVWFEIGRTDFYRESGVSYRELEETGALLAVVKLEVRYTRPARYDDLLTLETSLTRATRAKLEHSYRLTRDGIVLATASTTLACVDRAGALQPMPGSLAQPQQSQPMCSFLSTIISAAAPFSDHLSAAPSARFDPVARQSNLR